MKTFEEKKDILLKYWTRGFMKITHKEEILCPQCRNRFMMGLQNPDKKQIGYFCLDCVPMFFIHSPFMHAYLEIKS